MMTIHDYAIYYIMNLDDLYIYNMCTCIMILWINAEELTHWPLLECCVVGHIARHFQIASSEELASTI